MDKPEYFIGLMSGTSADGVDAALIRIEQNQIHLESFTEFPIPSDLKQTLVALNHTPSIELQQLCQLQKEIAELFSKATLKLLKTAEISASQITAIGSHGQTIFHAPDIPMTLQIGHPAFITKQTGITTVADFRVDDMALGGQGAPFAPVFHQELFANDKACFAVNIGGIANISYLPEKQSAKPISGWDTGPGNALMDELCQKAFACQYDKNGDLAKQGKVHKELLQTLQQHPYLNKPAPKSTGRETFCLDWVSEVIEQQKIKIETIDLLATLSEFTAITIADQIKTIGNGDEDIWIVGGGAFNPDLINRIQAQLERHSVLPSQSNNIDPNAVEAMMCAWLAMKRVNNDTVALSSVTGADRDCVLGAIWHP